MARAPQAIYKVWSDIDKKIPRAVLSGIVGDVHHSFGYHLSRNELPTSDYSVQLSKDKRGASDCASALDVSLPPDLMKLCTARLLKAAKAKDPRLAGVREFCGTLNGYETYPWDLSDNSSEGINSWDNSHLWHIHISFYRQYADNYDAIKGVAAVMAGTPLQRAWQAFKGSPYPFKGNNVFGPLSGPAWQHGGATKTEQAYVHYIKVRLHALGYKNTSLSNGMWGTGTTADVRAWQKATGRKVTGLIGASDWKALTK